MTTPSRYRKLNDAATAYAEFQFIAIQLCQTIKKLHGGLKFDGDQTTDEAKEMVLIATQIATEVEKKFHEILDPYVKRLEEIDQAIKANLPKPPGTIILPGDDVN